MNRDLRAIVSLILLTWIVLAGITYAAQDRKPVGPPVEKEPPLPPEDPCDSPPMDQSCTPEGKSSGPFAQEAWIAAAQACDGDTSCHALQSIELNMNKGICESRSTDEYSCILDYSVPTSNNCSDKMNTLKECTPAPQEMGDPLKTTFVCTVKGNYDITDYKCKTDPSGPHGEEE